MGEDGASFVLGDAKSIAASLTAWASSHKLQTSEFSRCARQLGVEETDARLSDVAQPYWRPDLASVERTRVSGNQSRTKMPGYKLIGARAKESGPVGTEQLRLSTSEGREQKSPNREALQSRRQYLNLKVAGKGAGRAWVVGSPLAGWGAEGASGPPKHALLEVLKAAGKPARVVTQPDGTEVVLLPYGGRVLGLFAPGSEDNFNWTHPALRFVNTATSFYDSAQVWAFRGPKEAIEAVLKTMLGPERI